MSEVQLKFINNDNNDATIGLVVNGKWYYRELNESLKNFVINVVMLAEKDQNLKILDNINNNDYEVISQKEFFNSKKTGNPLIDNEVVRNVLNYSKKNGTISAGFYDILTEKIKSNREVSFFDDIKTNEFDFDKFKNMASKYVIEYGNKEFYDEVSHYWYLFGSGKNFDKTTDRLYINIDNDKIADIIPLLVDISKVKKISFRGKFHIPNQRKDGMVLYMDKDNYPRILNLLKTIYKEKPEIFNENFKSTMCSENVRIPGVGHAEEPIYDKDSFNLKISRDLNRAMSIVMLESCMKNPMIIYANSDFFSHLTSEKYKDFNGGLKEKVQKLLIDMKSLPIVSGDKGFYGSGGVIGKGADMFFHFETWELKKFFVEKFLNKGEDISNFAYLINSEIVNNAILYGVEPTNLALNNRRQIVNNRTREDEIGLILEHLNIVSKYENTKTKMR